MKICKFTTDERFLKKPKIINCKKDNFEMTNLDRWAEKWEKIEGSEILQTNGEIEKNFQIFQVLARALNCFDDSMIFKNFFSINF
jgi:hypothetical protein